MSPYEAVILYCGSQKHSVYCQCWQYTDNCYPFLSNFVSDFWVAFIFFMCTCVYVYASVCRCVCVPVHGVRRPEVEVGSLFNRHPPYSLRQNFSWAQRAPIQLVSLAILLLKSLGSWNLTSSPHTCTESTFTTEASPQPEWPLFQY